MQKRNWIRKGILAECILLLALGMICFRQELRVTQTSAGAKEKKGYIKWVEFHPTEELMTLSYRLDVETYDKPVHIDWIELLAWLAAKHGGEFPSGCAGELQELGEKLKNGETTMDKETAGMKYYSYYKEAYEAVLGGFVGEYRLQCTDETGKVTWKDCYGIKAFSPIAKGFYYDDYDDFGASRSYGYARPHLGHDMMGQVGTPIWI